MNTLKIKSSSHVKEILLDFQKFAHHLSEDYERLEVYSTSNNEAMLTAYHFGKKVKEFKWLTEAEIDDESGEKKPINSSDLLDVLNQLPELEVLELSVGKIKINKKTKLKLSNLKKLRIFSSAPSTFKFFSNVLPKNSIIDLKIYVPRDCKEGNVENLKKFFENQKSIKTLSTNFFASFKVIEKLSLESLKIKAFDLYGNWIPEAPKNDKFDKAVAEALSKQKELKHFSFGSYNMTKVTDQFSQLHQLETLKLDVYYGCPFGDKLKGLRELKSVKIRRCNDGDFLLNFLSEKHEKLEEISTPDDVKILNCDMIENAPNLVKFSGTSEQTLNAFAKFMPKLEILYLTYIGCRRICELDTKIESESLKEIFLIFKFDSINHHIEDLLEIFEMCPNLEILKLRSMHHYKFLHWIISPLMYKPFEKQEKWGSQSKDLIEKKFFETLSEVQSLKHLEMDWIDLKNFGDFLPQIGENLNKIAERHEFVDITFKDVFHRDNPRKFSYQTLVDVVKEKYEIKTYEEKHNHRNLHICSRKNE